MCHDFSKHHLAVLRPEIDEAEFWKNKLVFILIREKLEVKRSQTFYGGLVFFKALWRNKITLHPPFVFVIKVGFTSFTFQIRTKPEI